MTQTVEPLIFARPEAVAQRTLSVEGDLPGYIKGCYYLNGPALFQRNGLTYNHWLDGDAMLRQLRFQDGAVTFQSRYLGSRKHREEEAEDRPIYRNFGTAFAGDRLNPSGLGLEANINVSAYPFKDRLLAFGEQALPLEIDPHTLETKGVCDFNGALKEHAPFSGHPKFDPNNGRICNFGVHFLGKRGMLTYYELDEHLQLDVKAAVTLPLAANMHDFAVSPNYACFFLAPYVLDVRRVSREGQSLLDALSWADDHSCQLIVLNRADGSLAARIPLERTSYCLHLINAFEREGRLVVDLIDTPRPFFDQYLHRKGMFADIAPCATLRLEVNTQEWRLSHLEEMPHELHLDFPSMERARLAGNYQHYWILGMPTHAGPKFYNQLLRFDWSERNMADRYQAPAGVVLSGEPAHIADPNNPGQGTVLVQSHHLETGHSTYLLFNAYELAAGPIARMPLNCFDPMGFHSVFQPDGGFRL